MHHLRGFAKHLENVATFISLRRIGFHKHHEIDRHISDLVFLIELSFVGNDSGRKNIILWCLQKIIEGTVHRIVLTRFDLNRMDTHCCVVVNQIVNLTLFAVVVIKEFVTQNSGSPRCMMKSSYTAWFSTLFNNYFRPKTTLFNKILHCKITLFNRNDQTNHKKILFLHHSVT